MIMETSADLLPFPKPGFAQRAFSGLFDLLYPPHCFHCAQPLPDGPNKYLCDRCFKTVRILKGESCPRCAHPGKSPTGEDCQFCRTRTLRFDAAVAAVEFGDASRAIIHALKYHGNMPAARLLGGWLAAALNDHPMRDSNLIIPVPLHRSRLAHRGFNQALLIAGTLSATVNKPLHDGNLRRIRHTETQTRMSVAKREENVKGAFSLRKPVLVAGRSIILVDDVMTTGATMSECARILKAAGARSVLAVVAARA